MDENTSTTAVANTPVSEVNTTATTTPKVTDASAPISTPEVANTDSVSLPVNVVVESTLDHPDVEAPAASTETSTPSTSIPNPVLSTSDVSVLKDSKEVVDETPTPVVAQLVSEPAAIETSETTSPAVLGTLTIANTDALHQLLPTSFTKVADMNEAFNTPKGDPLNIDWDKVKSESKNIIDKLGELFTGLGADKLEITAAVENFKRACYFSAKADLEKVRDALANIHVIGYGTHHVLGIDADKDVHVAVEGVMSRFIKDEADKAETIAMHAAKGIKDFLFEGEFPKMFMKSTKDQPNAPAGTILKSASYKAPVFAEVGAEAKA